MSDGRRRARVAGRLFVLIWLSCAWFGSWEWNPNNAVRLFAAMSIVEDGDATIDQFAGLTIDKARFGDNYYSDKAPGVTLMALPAVAAVNAATGQRSRDISLSMYDLPSSDFLRLRERVVSATTAALLTAIAAVAVFALAGGLGASLAGASFAAIAFALGTPLWGWSTTLFGHAPVTALFAIALWAVWRGTDGARPSPGHAALAGAALGWAVVVEYSAVLTGLPIGVFALWRLWRFAPGDRWRAIGAAALPALIAALVLVAYNLFAFGTPFRLGYQGVVGFEGMNQGLFGLTYPKPSVVWEITVGLHRGMIWVAPVALAGLAGLILLLRRPATRAIGVVGLAGAVTLLLYNAAYAYWDGGNSTGPRHLLPAVAYLSLGFAPLWDRLRGAGARGALIALLLLSVGINLVIAAAEIATGGQGAFPLWSDVAQRFIAGDVRTLPSEFLNWSPVSGLLLYLALAGGIAAMLVAAIRERNY